MKGPPSGERSQFTQQHGHVHSARACPIGLPLGQGPQAAGEVMAAV